MKSNYEESLSYKCEKYIETLDMIDMLRIELSQKVKLLSKLQKEIESWVPEEKTESWKVLTDLKNLEEVKRK